MCWARISVNFLSKDGPQTLDDPEDLIIPMSIPETLVWQSRVRQILQNDDCNVNSFLILFEKKVTSSSKAKMQALGRIS